MASPSRTEFPDYIERPAICCECGKRVTLKQSHRFGFDERTRTGRIWHTACDPFTVRVVVSRRVPPPLEAAA